MESTDRYNTSSSPEWYHWRRLNPGWLLESAGRHSQLPKVGPQEALVILEGEAPTAFLALRSVRMAAFLSDCLRNSGFAESVRRGLAPLLLAGGRGFIFSKDLETKNVSILLLLVRI